MSMMPISSMSQPPLGEEHLLRAVLTLVIQGRTIEREGPLAEMQVAARAARKLLGKRNVKLIIAQGSLGKDQPTGPSPAVLAQLGLDRPMTTVEDWSPIVRQEELRRERAAEARSRARTKAWVRAGQRHEAGPETWVQRASEEEKDAMWQLLLQDMVGAR